MKKNLIKLGISIMLCSSLHAFDYNVVSGKQNLAAVIDIDDLTIFDKASVDYVYQYDFSQTPPVYKYYDVNGTFPDKAGGSVLTSLKKGEGFILVANSADTISDISSAIVFKGDSYYEVTSPTTQAVWLDRNIGATAVCTKKRTDFNSESAYTTSQEECFGDYYQWGRGNDGHENKNSLTTSNMPNDWSNPGTSRFILADDSSHAYDWEKDGDDSGQARRGSWSQTDGSTVCPANFRVPTSAELMAETANMSNLINVLKFPIAGKRDRATGNIYYEGYVGYIWSTDPHGLYENVRTRRLVYDENTFNDAQDDRGYGYSVRCIRE